MIYAGPRRRGLHHSSTRKLSVKTLKAILLMVTLELTCAIFTYFRGYGFNYFMMLTVILPLSILAFIIVYHFNADILIYVWTVIILNFGFLVQCLSAGKAAFNSMSVLKILIAMTAAIIAGVAYRFLSGVLSTDTALVLIIGIQVTLCVLLALFGKTTGSASYQGARLNLEIGKLSIQPLEIVKLLYIFVAAALLCKNERVDCTLAGIPRSRIFVIYSAVTLLSVVGFGELGAFMMIAMTGTAMLIIFAHERKYVHRVLLAEVLFLIIGIAAVTAFHSEVLLLEKIYLRFAYAMHPETAESTYGYQGCQIREAITVGSYFGPATRRYIMNISMQDSDLIFAKSVQVCGIIPAIFMMFGYMCFIKTGNDVAVRAKDTYFSGIAMGISILFGVQCIYNIGVNIGLLPISGITLYLQSSGFTSLTVGLVMTAILLVISTGTPERSPIDERIAQNTLGISRFIHSRRRTQTECE